MSFTFGFYNSLNHDRKYNAIQMSSIFDGIIKDGIFMSIGTCMMVKANSGMTVTVGEGRAWFNHTWSLNDADMPVILEESELVLHRIDAIVLDVDARDSVRTNSIMVLKGTPSSSPVAPTLTNSIDHHQYPLAEIYVKAGVTEITTADITNKVGTENCPFVTGILETVDIDDLISKWEAEFDQFLDLESEQFLAWFDNIKGQLGTDAAGNLQNQVDQLSADIKEEIIRFSSQANHLDNSDFTQFVAQAGIGGAHGTQDYAGDRWILDSGTVTGEANANGNGYSNITLNGTIRQIIADPPAVGSVGIEMVSGTAEISYADGEVAITSSGGVIKNVSLLENTYLADNFPKFQPKGYGAELAECQRYFIKLGNGTVGMGNFIGTGLTLNASGVSTVFIPLPVKMRVVPTVSIESNTMYLYGAGSYYVVNNITVNALFEHGVSCRIAHGAHNTLFYGCALSVQYISFSADL